MNKIDSFIKEELKKQNIKQYDYKILKKQEQDFILNDKKVDTNITTLEEKVSISFIKNNKLKEIIIPNTLKEEIKKKFKNDNFKKTNAINENEYDLSTNINMKFNRTNEQSNKNQIINKIKRFQSFVEKKYPEINIDYFSLKYINVDKFYQNSNNTNIKVEKDYYNIYGRITASKDDIVSSISYIDYNIKKLDKEIIKIGRVKEKIETLISYINSDNVNINNSFKGEIICSPEVLNPKSINGLMKYLCKHLSEDYLFSKKSKYINSIGNQIASSKFSMYSSSTDKEIVPSKFITKRGYLYKNEYIIKNGKLKNYIISKMSVQNRLNYENQKLLSNNLIIESGKKDLNKMIKNCRKGVLLNRLSGANNISKNGDFSGTCKNSFLIKNGEIKGALEGEIIEGNIRCMLQNILSISNKRINFGNFISPWIKFLSTN